VDEVLDIVEEAITMRQRSAHKGLWGSAVVGQRIVDFLDLYTVLQAVGEDWSDKRGRSANAATVLLAEASAFSRGLLRGGLEMAGYHVIEASNAPDAFRSFNRRPADLLMTSLDLPPAGGLSLLESLRRQSGQEKLPAVALLDDSQQRVPRQNGNVDFDEYQRKFDWEAIVDSVQRLSAAVSGREGTNGQTRPTEVSR
jgi:CheY-like chemotaxis protein